MKQYLQIFPLVAALAFANLLCSPNSKPVTPLSSDDYAIYSALVNDLSSSHEHRLAFIWDSTFTSVVASEFKVVDGKRTLIYHNLGIGNHAPSPSDDIKLIWPEFDLEFYRSEFDRNNANSYALVLDSMHTLIQIQPVKTDSISSHMISSGEALQIWFSRAAFNHQHDEAVIYLDYICGSLCGEGKWYWMKQSRGSWKVYKSFHTWVS